MTNRSYRIVTYKQAFEEVLEIDFNNQLKKLVSDLEKQGHTEKSISYAIWRTKEKLLENINEEYFVDVLRSEILKYSWAKDDKRWNDYNKKKNREIKINEYAKKLNVNDFICFVQGENGGAIRISYTINPSITVNSLESSYPDKLKILLVIHGHGSDVIKLQNKFRKYKLKGGWFKPDKEIFDEIERLKQEYPYVAGD